MGVQLRYRSVYTHTVFTLMKDTFPLRPVFFPQLLPGGASGVFSHPHAGQHGRCPACCLTLAVSGRGLADSSARERTVNARTHPQSHPGPCCHQSYRFNTTPPPPRHRSTPVLLSGPDRHPEGDLRPTLWLWPSPTSLPPGSPDVPRPPAGALLGPTWQPLHECSR